MSNKDKSILITGCSSGIGYCLAHGLKHHGYSVIASCRKDTDVERLNSDGLSTIQLDLNSSSSIQKGFDKCMSKTNGNLYGLINNGAYGQPGALQDISRDALKAQFETNVFGTHELTQLALKSMRLHNKGRVIQISSILGFICLKFRGPYNASKYALEALTDTMRLELHDTDIQFSLIEPGPILSRFRDNAYAAFIKEVDIEQSVYKADYAMVQSRLKADSSVKFTLPPEAVLDAVLHALQSNNPKIRYRVTMPTKIMAWLKRTLSDRMMDRFLLKSGDKTKKK